MKHGTASSSEKKLKIDSAGGTTQTQPLYEWRTWLQFFKKRIPEKEGEASFLEENKREKVFTIKNEDHDDRSEKNDDHDDRSEKKRRSRWPLWDKSEDHDDCSKIKAKITMTARR